MTTTIETLQATWARITGQELHPLATERLFFEVSKMAFSAEVGPEKGSWKGGTVGHGIDMLPGESPKEAFQRYCEKPQERKGKQYNLRFIGPCAPPTGTTKTYETK